MGWSFVFQRMVAFLSFLSIASAVAAHEVMPAIADFEVKDGQVVFSVELNAEGIIAGIDMSAVADTNAAPEVSTYDALRALSADELTARIEADRAVLENGITVNIGGMRQSVSIDGISVPTDVADDLPRGSVVTFSAPVPADGADMVFQWDSRFGAIVLRQQGVEEPYTGYLETGSASEPVPLAGGGALPIWQTFLSYIPTGFEHIVPLGLDHILFVLGLFFLSSRMKPLLWQVSAFTVAHTITLALASLGYVSAPGRFVEPLIAASIVFVAVENLYSKGFSPWRPVVVFMFGLLHGLGFASVLEQFGLPQHGFVAALIGFNIGVELGQLFVISCAFLAVGLWFGNRPWYRRVIAVPASVGIAVVGAWWVIERTIL